MKITDAQVKAAYSVARRVYLGEVTPRDGAQELHTKDGLNINSARDFIEDYKALLQGRVFQRAMSAPAMEYFLSRIGKDNGRRALSTSLEALRKHITYYENISGVNLNKMRSVAARVAQKIDQPLDFEQFQENFQQAIQDARKLAPKVRKQRLKEARQIPVRSSAVVTVFVRNPYVVADVLERANGTCERCKDPAPFCREKDGTPYLEVHHKIRLADGGHDSVDNALALCPNCHRELHYGQRHAQQGAPADAQPATSRQPEDG